MHREPTFSSRLLEGYRVFAACFMSLPVIVVERVAAGSSGVHGIHPITSPLPPSPSTLRSCPVICGVQKQGGVWFDDMSINR